MAACGAGGVGARGGVETGMFTAGVGVRGVGRSGGSDAPCASDATEGVGTRGLTGGVGTRGLAAGVILGDDIGVTGRAGAAGVARFCGGTKGPGGVRLVPNASPSGSTGVGRRTA